MWPARDFWQWRRKMKGKEVHLWKDVLGIWFCLHDRFSKYSSPILISNSRDEQLTRAGQSEMLPLSSHSEFLGMDIWIRPGQLLPRSFAEIVSKEMPSFLWDNGLGRRYKIPELPWTILVSSGRVRQHQGKERWDPEHYLSTWSSPQRPSEPLELPSCWTQ